MIKEEIKIKLQLAHDQENEFNKKINTIDKRILGCKSDIRRLEKEKNKLRYLVSKNMKYRNELIKQL